MRPVKGSAIVLALLSGQAFADSIINYTVELAPYNHAYTTAWKGGTNRVLFTAGNPGDGQQFTIGDVITWDVVAALDPNGTHNQPGHASHGKKPYGIANIVFNLELTDSTGSPVSTGTFFSAVNDGNDGDPLAASAFAASFNFLSRGPGRLIDQVGGTSPGHGGPNMALYTYPTAMPDRLLLLGQGAGYVQWKRTSATNTTITVPGVGLVTLPDANQTAGLGVVPLFEGQIDTSNMAPGQYKLRVIPGAGVNVLRGDYTDFLANDKDAFAVAVNSQNGDEIAFTLTTAPVGCQVAPVITAATSYRVHGTAGPLGVPLALSGPLAVEPRDGGPQQIVVTYDKAIGPADGTLDAEVSLSVGSLNGPPTIDNNYLIVNLSGVPDGSCLGITISGMTCAEGGVVAPPAMLRVIALKGDLNGNGAVNVADVGLVKSFSGSAVTQANFRGDVNVNGAINVADVGIVKSLSNATTVGPCP